MGNAELRKQLGAQSPQAQALANTRGYPLGTQFELPPTRPNLRCGPDENYIVRKDVERDWRWLNIFMKGVQCSDPSHRDSDTEIDLTNDPPPERRQRMTSPVRA